MEKILFCLLLLNIDIAFAQNISWVEGSLVIHNDEVLVGQIHTEVKHDLVLFQRENTLMVYPAHLIKAFHFYDRKTNVNRRFVSLSDQNTKRREYHLYEVVVPGEITVFRRKKASAFSNHADALDYNYFIYYNNSLLPLVKFASTIFPNMLTGSDKTVKRFISENRLKPYSAAGAIRIIKFYNEKLSTGSLQCVNQSAFD